MDGRTLMMILALLTVTVVALGTWRASALSQECARHGGTYSLMDKRCNGARSQPRIILHRDLLRT